MQRVLIGVFFTTLSLAVAAQDLSRFERVLLPGWSPESITGAAGTSFGTKFVIYATKSIAVYPAGKPGAPIIGTTAISFCSVLDFVFQPPVPAPVAGRARLLYFEPGFDRAVTFQYTVIVSQRDEPYCETTLPVVREPDFRSEPMYILGVPTTPILTWPPGSATPIVAGYVERNMLRVYDVDNTGVLEVAIRWRLQTPTFCSWSNARVVTVNRRDGSDPSYPYYTEIDLNEIAQPCIPGFSDLSPCVSFDRILEIAPTQSSGKYWAFVTTTRNDTQQVTVRMPQ